MSQQTTSKKNKATSNGVRKLLFFTTSLLFVPISQVFAHEEGGEFTDVAASDWTSPLIAILIIAGAIILARIIRKRLSRQITNNNITN